MMVRLEIKSKTGAVFGKLTLSKFTALPSVLLCDVTANPHSAVLAKPVRLELPKVIQALPLAEYCAVNVVPLRVSRTQYGAAGPLTATL